MSGTGSNPFDPRVMVAIATIGVIGFIAMWALIALGPSLARGNDGGGHGLSRGAPGFAAIIDMAERSGADIWLDRVGDADGGLLVVTPPHGANAGDVRERLTGHDGPVLVVLPKWRASGPRAAGTQPGWSGPAQAMQAPGNLLDAVRDGLGNKELGPWRANVDRGAETAALTSALGGTMADAARASAQPIKDAQHVVGKGLFPLLSMPDGRALLVQVEGREAYILAEPDFINNIAFDDAASARRALILLDAIAADAAADSVTWDVTLNGLGGGRSLLRLAFTPPFIGVTLCLILAGVLALWQAAVRFGPAKLAPRALPLSQRALIDNSVALIGQARRGDDAAPAWLASWRDGMARALHAPAGLNADALDAWIEARRTGRGGRSPDGGRVADLALGLLTSRNQGETLAAAGALYQIRKELLRDHG